MLLAIEQEIVSDNHMRLTYLGIGIRLSKKGLIPRFKL